MVVIIYCVFFVIIAKNCICQTNNVTANESHTNIDVLTTLSTPSTSVREGIILGINETEQGISIELDPDDNITIFDDFFNVLTSVSVNQLKQVKKNIKSYYSLNKKEIRDVDNTFNNTYSSFEYMLLYKLKEILYAKKFNDSEEFMLDFMDFSNFMIEKIIGYNLKMINNRSLLNITNWHQQSLKDKILRQQAKISKTLVEMQMCNMMDVCKQKEHYSDYIVEWLRCLLDENDLVLKEVFNVVPVIIDKYPEFIKSSIMFRKNMQYAAKKKPSAQRDVLDFMDETITNENVFTLIPVELQKCGVLFIELLNGINDVYDLNDKNFEELENISDKLLYQNSDVKGLKDILDAIIKNMKINFKTWPEEKRVKIKKTWFEIIQL